MGIIVVVAAQLRGVAALVQLVIQKLYVQLKQSVTTYEMIGKYERGDASPSIDAAKRSLPLF